MDKEIKTTITSIVVFIAILGGVLGGVFMYSGLNPPFSTITSQSMQHEMGTSHLGIIDTADIVLVRDPGRVDIQSYVDGYVSGYSNFGEYGDVIIYYRAEPDSGNPIIHRPIIWLDKNLGADGNWDGTWSAPSLEEYPTELWSCSSGDDYMSMTGVLSMYKIGFDEKTINIDLHALSGSKSGFITMGDNKDNTMYDQSWNISYGQLVSEERIKSVAGIEIPWAGWFNLYMDQGYSYLEKRVSNTLPCIIVSTIAFIMVFVVIFMFLDYYEFKNREEDEDFIDGSSDSGSGLQKE